MVYKEFPFEAQKIKYLRQKLQKTPNTLRKNYLDLS